MQKLKAYLIIIFYFFGFTIVAQQELQSGIDKILETYEIKNSPGLAIRVIQNNKILYSKGIGIANLDYNIKNADSTIFSLASISKQFTAAAVWALIEDSKLSLEDSITKFFPDFPEYGSSIKIKHLLNHSSGIRNYHTTMYLSGFDYDNDYYDNSYVLELAQRQKNLNNLPGQKIIYSNTNYNLLALIIEQLSNLNLNDYLKAKILNPLGMTNTFVRVGHGTPIKNKAIGYQNKNGKHVFNTSTQLSYGAGSMGSNTKEMTIWMNMLNEQIPAFKTLAQFLKKTETLPSGQKVNYARGIMVDQYKDYKTLSHSGFGFGGQSQLVTVPEENIGIVILTNLQSINPTPISYKILDLLLEPKNNTKVNLEKSILYNKQNLQEFIGGYKELNSDMTMQISIENDTLKSLGSAGKTKIALVQNSTHEFVRLNAQNVKYNFKKTTEYDMIISFGGTPFYFKRAHLITETPENLKDLEGFYYSEELQTKYHFFVEDNSLKLSYKNHKDIKLYPIQLNEFGNRDRTLYHFVTTEDGEISGMLLSCDGQISNIGFVKDQTQY